MNLNQKMSLRSVYLAFVLAGVPIMATSADAPVPAAGSKSVPTVVDSKGVAAPIAATTTGTTQPSTPASPVSTPAPVDFLPKEGAMRRCESKAFRKCMKLKEVEACKKSLGEAVDAVNADMRQKAAEKKDMNPDQRSFYEGMALGSFLGEMIKRSDGRFLNCVRVQ